MATFDRNSFDDLLEAYLDDDLTPEMSRRFEAFVASDGEAREELRFAKAVQQRLHSMPQPTCPRDVTTAVLSAARADARRGFVERLRIAAVSGWNTVLRPSLAMGAFVAVVVAGALISRPGDDRPAHILAERAASPEEVEQALEDAKWALAYISNVGRRTATRLRDDVLDEHVVGSLNRGLTAAFDDEETHVQ